MNNTSVDFHLVTIWAFQERHLLIVDAEINTYISKFLGHLIILGSHGLDAIVSGWRIWVEFQITLYTNFDQVCANFVVRF